MNLVPISNPFRPMFFARCCKCNQETRSDLAAADLDGPAFNAYVCFGCQPQDVRDAVGKASSESFAALPASLKHDIRVQTLGHYKTREIEERAARRDA